MDWKKIVGDIAPVIAGALSGGNPVVTALTASIVKKALGLSGEVTDDHITQAMQSDPDALVKIKQAETELKEKLSQNGVDIEAIMAADRANARKSQITTKDKTPRTMTIWASINFTVVIIVMGILEYTGKLSTMTAIEASILTLILRETFALVQNADSFWFGSSAGSRDKDDTIQSLSQ